MLSLWAKLFHAFPLSSFQLGYAACTVFSSYREEGSGSGKLPVSEREQDRAPSVGEARGSTTPRPSRPSPQLWHSHVPSSVTSSGAWACRRVGRSTATTVYWSWAHSGRCRASVSFTNRVPVVSSAEVTIPRALQLALESCSLYCTWMPLNSWQFSTQTFPI